MDLDETDPVATTTVSDASSNQNESPAAERPEKRDERDAPKDLRGQLRAAVDTHREPSRARQDAAAKRDRAGNGTFAPSEIKGDEQPKEPAQPKPVSADQRPPDAQATPKPDKARSAPAPEALSKDIRAIWDTIPENLRNEFIRREADSTKGVEQLKERYRPLEEVFSPYRHLLQQRGLTEVDAVKQLFGWQAALAGPNKADAAKALLQAHGIDVATLAAGHNGAPREDAPQPEQPLHPAFQQLSTDVGALKSQFQRDAETRAATQIAAFAKDRPHFDKVRVDMAKLMDSGLSSDLEDAYQRAIWANPETRAAIQQEETSQREAEAKAAADKARADAAAADEAKKRKDAEELERARRAGVSPRAGAPTGPVSPHRAKGKSVGADLRDAIQEARGAV